MSVRVLVVDDQEPFRMTAQLVVEMTDGFEVVVVSETGEDAIEATRALNPDLILMDVKMPGIDGVEATRRILDDHNRVVVLVMSTYEEGEYGPLAAECGAASYVTKSEFSPDQLVELWEAAKAS
jgi:DNA-binding NarL/FixJ family response regulator